MPHPGLVCFVFLCLCVSGVCSVLVLVVSTGAIDCLERLVSEMACYVSSGTLNLTHPVTYSLSAGQVDGLATGPCGRF